MLARAMRARPPKFPTNSDRPTPPAVKVSALEEYLFETAYLGAELEEVLFALEGLVTYFADQIDRMTGYEMALPRKPKDRITQADITTAKRTTDPVSFDAAAEAKAMRGGVQRQIERFRFEAQYVVSRGYSMISGS